MFGSRRRRGGFATAIRGGADAVRDRTGGTACGSANRRVHFSPVHQRMRASSSGSRYQPAGATGGGSSAFRGSRCAARRSVDGARIGFGAGFRALAPLPTLTRTGPTSVVARILIRSAMRRLCASRTPRHGALIDSG